MVVFMAESSVYKNGKITNWYEYTVSRFNSLLGIYMDKSIPDDFIEMKGRYLLKGTEMLRAEGMNDLAFSIEKMYGKMVAHRKNTWHFNDDANLSQDASAHKRA